MGIYFCNCAEPPAVPSTEILIPIVMMWVLSVIHSEIVATNPGPERKRTEMEKQRCYRKRRSKGKRVTIAKRAISSPEGRRSWGRAEESLEEAVEEVKEGGSPVGGARVGDTNTSDSDSQR